MLLLERSIIFDRSILFIGIKVVNGLIEVLMMTKMVIAIINTKMVKELGNEISNHDVRTSLYYSICFFKRDRKSKKEEERK